MIHIDYIADLACPWCYLGLVRLDRARAMRGTRRSAALVAVLPQPRMPPEGMDRQAYLRAKFGGDANAQGIYARIREAAGRTASSSPSSACRGPPTPCSPTG